jgi:DNA polymerase III delta subunit
MSEPGGQTAAFPAGFFLLCGDDTILREKARADAIAAACAGRPDTPVERYNADDNDFSSFSERIITPSLLSSARIFHISDVHLLDEKDLALLSGLFGYDLPDACVIMESDRLRAERTKKSKDAGLSKKYLAWLDAFEDKASGSPARFSVKEFVKPPDYKMAEWVVAQVPFLFGRRIAKADAEHLIDLVGLDTAMLHSELQKIDLYLPDKAVIDQTVIDEVAGATRLMTPFELAAALGRKDLARALEIIGSIYTANVYLPLFVGAIFRHFWSLFKISEFAKVKPDVVRGFRASLKSYNRQLQEETGVAIGAAAGLFSEKQVKSVYPVLVKSGIVDQALSFETKQYKAIFAMLKDYDTGLKTGRADDSKTGFELFCYRIVRDGLS